MKNFQLFSGTAQSSQRRVHSVCIILFSLFFAGAVLITPVVQRVPIAQAHADRLTCQTTHILVALAPDQPKQYQIFGELCTRSNRANDLVQVLLPGATYSHVYWNFPYQPETYSYVDALTTPNYATFNIDRLSTGQSSHPASSLVTLDADAYTVHQVIQGLRQGIVDGIHFRKVILVGHSLGSNVLWHEAANYHDIDGAIVTGGMHKVSAINEQQAFSLSYPATQDPKFSMSGLDAGYITTTAPTATSPSGRQVLFYNLPDADPRVIAIDEASKDTAVVSEIMQSGSPSIAADTLKINVPVLTVVGQNDFIQCGPGGTDCSSDQTVQKAEAPFYPHACLEAHILPNSGHDINLHLNAPDWFKMAKNWLNAFFGDGSARSGQCKE